MSDAIWPIVSRSFLLPNLQREFEMDAVGGYQLLGRVSDDRPLPVWKGRHPASARSVALKQVELTTDDAIDRLRAQVRVLAGIAHPSLVEVLELIEDQDHAWLVEEWVDGISLSALLAEGGAFSPQQAAAVVSDVLAGLAHVHHRAIVHGGVSTATVLIDQTGTARLTDFGVTAGRSGSPVTLQSDVHSVGSVLCQLQPDLPPELAQVGRTALADEPGFRDAASFRTALDQAAAECFGADWREHVDLTSRVHERATAPVGGPSVAAGAESAADAVHGSVTSEPAQPVVAPSGSLPSALPPSVQAHRVKVRSPKRSARPPEAGADAPPSLEPGAKRLAPGDGNPGKTIPIIAAVVVVAAIIILVLSRHDMKKTTTAATTFKGSYTVTATLKSAGVGADQGRPLDSVRTETWQVSSTCPATGECTATVTSAGGSAFALAFANGAWTGERAMPALGTCSGAYSVSLIPSGTSGAQLLGTMLGVAGGCAQQGTETEALVVTRAK